MDTPPDSPPGTPWDYFLGFVHFFLKVVARECEATMKPERLDELAEIRRNVLTDEKTNPHVLLLEIRGRVPDRLPREMWPGATAKFDRLEQALLAHLRWRMPRPTT